MKYIQSSKPIICVDSFIEMADIVLPECERPSKKYVNKTKVIFVSIGCLNTYIPYLLSLTFDYILITGGNDDWCMPYFYFPPHETDKALHDSLLEHPYLIKWCSKNICISHPKLMAIPLGPKMQWDSHEFFGEDKTSMMQVYSKHCLQPQYAFQSEKPNLLYLNMANTTNNPFFREHSGIRVKTLELLSSKDYKILPNVPFEKYIETLKSYKFSVSPPGRGIDSHRTWESLMVGTIPICISTPIDPVYEGLPVLIVKDYSEINDEFLNQKYEEIVNKTYNFTKLYIAYWEKLISETVS